MEHRGLDHFALVVPSTDEALKVWRDRLGFPLLYSEVVNGGAVRLTHLDLGNTHLQLVEPLVADHPLREWLAKNGPGLHHFCLKVPDVGVAQASLPAQGIAVAAQIHEGTCGKRALFLDRAGTQGVQVEVTGSWHGGFGKSQFLAALPAPGSHDLAPVIRQSLALSTQKLVVLDDDPTGTQTVRDVPVLTTWEIPTLVSEFENELPCFYVLTNSRSRSAAEAREMNLVIARNLKAAAARTKRRFVVVSRGDSTLRGHFPVETDALAEILGPFDATVLFPYFEAGGRYTVDNIHYVAEGDVLTPAAQTSFARDVVFGYRSSDLREYIQEKTNGRIAASAVESVSVAELRPQAGDAAQAIGRRLRELPAGSMVVVNSCHPRDAESFALATIHAERAGCRLLYRTSAQFVAARLGLSEQAPWRPQRRSAQAPGGLVVVGSHVPKTTEQLQRLLSERGLHVIELAVPGLLAPDEGGRVVADAATVAAEKIALGTTVVIFTSRELIAGDDNAHSLAIGRQVSGALVRFVQGINVRPDFIVAKGGITSSDLATRALGVKRAVVRGQIIPGVPVWETGPETRFPGLNYIVFPGNVGGPEALVEVCNHLRG